MRSGVQFLGLALVAMGLLLGVGGYWSLTTIIADCSPPVILEEATTSGDTAYISGKPHLVLIFEENVGVQSATAEIREVGLLGTVGSLVEEVALEETSHTGTNYQYEGKPDTPLARNKEYWVIYRVVDTAGNSDTYKAKIKLVDVTAEVYVNGRRVEHTYDKIVINTLTLNLEARVTSGAAGVARIHATITHNGETNTLEFANTGPGTWTATYKLPEDGVYTLYVKLVDTGGGETMLASFTIQLGAQYRAPLVYGTLGMLGLATLYYMTKPQAKKERGRGGRK